ncbi:MAG: substrate-binding domain-containing protein, partial [Firmicutes bacterium]|nr:substrate-binding domain-containing protein [Bacillota bacterium]
MKFVTVMSYYFDSTFRKFFLILIFMCGVLAYFVGKGSISPYSVFINKKLTIRSTGSTSMSRVLNLLSEEFMKIYPDFVYEKSETGSGAALISVKSRYTDIGDMSCEPKEFENLKKIYVALDGIAVIVNNNNMVSNLSLDSLRNIFKKKIKNWSE